jgi:ribosomal protein L35
MRAKGDENAQAEDEERRQETLQAHRHRQGEARRRGKRHRLISHNAKYIRQNRGTEVLADADTAAVKLWAPYGLK